ncbi:hypothetical protein WJX82_009632 [Trebouxia sp. C0006]
MGQKSPFPSLVPEDIWKSCGENVKLALVLLRKAKRGQDSPWQLWIESLPHEVATLMHWSDKELQQLQLDSTPAEKEFYDQIKQQLADITDDYRRLQSTPLVSDLDISLEDLIWASDMVTSRSFVFPKQEAWWSPLAVGTAVVVAGLAFKAPFINRWQYSSQISAGCRYAFTACMAAAFFQNKYSTEGSHQVALLPVIDLLNHNSTSQGELQASRFSSSLRAVSGPHGFVAGQEVTHSYGDKSNEMLLQFYGFVEMDNINDMYMADMYEWTKQRHNVSEDRWHFLESDPLVMQELHQAELKKSGWSDAVIESLRYLFASEQETEAGSALDPLQWFQALFKYREIPNVMTAWKQELSEKTEQQVFQVLHGFCIAGVTSEVPYVCCDGCPGDRKGSCVSRSSSIAPKCAVQVANCGCRLTSSIKRLLTASRTASAPFSLGVSLTGFCQHQDPHRGSSLLIRTATLEALTKIWTKIWAKIQHDSTTVHDESA